MATFQKVVSHSTGYTEALTGSGNVFVTNGDTAVISIGGTDYLSELAVGQKVSITRDGTTEVKEMASITGTNGGTFTTNWGGSTGLCTAHVEAGLGIVQDGLTVLKADASRTSLKRLSVDAESGTFGDIKMADSVITANAGDKYYPMHLYGDRDSYGTGLYIQQVGDGDALLIRKAGDGFWTTGIDNSTNLYSIGYDNSSPFFSLQDVFLTIDTDGDVKLSADHAVDTDYSVVTKKHFDENQIIYRNEIGYYRMYTVNSYYFGYKDYYYKSTADADLTTNKRQMVAYNSWYVPADGVLNTWGGYVACNTSGNTDDFTIYIHKVAAADVLGTGTEDWVEIHNKPFVVTTALNTASFNENVSENLSRGDLIRISAKRTAGSNAYIYYYMSHNLKFTPS